MSWNMLGQPRTRDCGEKVEPAQHKGQLRLHLVDLALHLLNEVGRVVLVVDVAERILNKAVHWDKDHHATARDEELGDRHEQHNGAGRLDLPSRRGNEFGFGRYWLIDSLAGVQKWRIFGRVQVDY